MSSTIPTALDLDHPGKQSAYFKLPNSTNTSGWGSLLLPVTLIHGGDGPTVLFTGGNHGDEYEGPIAIRKLANELQPEQVRGRVICVPSLNHPAVLAGTRLSPVDGKNMNRVFPGKPRGTLSERIADMVFQQFVTPSEVVVDIHSGGSSMIFAPCVLIHDLDDPEQMQKIVESGQAFGAPITVVLRELDSQGMLDTVVEKAGKVFVSTELGGGAFVTPRTLRIAERGIRNILRHHGVLDEPVEPPETPTQFLETPESGSYLMASHEGLYEVLVEVEEPVTSGQLLGRIHPLERWDDPVVEVRAEREGILVTRTGRGLVRRGDTIAVVATKWSGAA